MENSTIRIDKWKNYRSFNGHLFGDFTDLSDTFGHWALQHQKLGIQNGDHVGNIIGLPCDDATNRSFIQVVVPP